MKQDDPTGYGSLTRTEAARGGAGEGWGYAGTITVFLIVSRFDTDHALTYLFCEGTPPVAQVQNFVDSHRDRFRGSNVVIELGERYDVLAQAKQRALGLRSWLGNVNIVFPPLRIV